MSDLRTKRVLWADVLKILACFLVIVNHTHGFVFQYGEKNAVTALFYAAGFAVSKCAVPIFIMVSGLLLLQRETTWRKIFFRILRVVIPLALVFLYIYYIWYGTDMSLKRLLLSSLRDPLQTPFWYVYMLIGLYAVTPFMQKMIKNFSDRDFCAFILLTAFLPAVLNAVSAYFDVSFSKQFFVAFFPPALAYYAAGVYLARIPRKRTYFWTAVAAFVLSVAGLIVSIYVPYLRTGALSYKMDSWASLPVVIASLTVFYIVRYLLEEKTFGRISARVVTEISAVTFGVYLVHTFVNYRICKWSFMTVLFSSAPCMATLTTEVICFILCGVGIFLLRRIPGFKKIL